MAKPNPKLPELSAQDVERFWSKVSVGSPDECWPWIGSRTPNGYGFFKARGLGLKAHRVAYKLQHGNDPGDQLVCHKCDNRECCNGSHLFKGTQSDNMQDCVNKGRQTRLFGERQNGAKLSETSVRAIRAAYWNSNLRQSDIAATHGISRATVSAIICRKMWAHIPNPDGGTNRPPRKRHN